MITPWRPSDKAIERFRVRCSQAALNDPRLSVASLDSPPPGYVTDAYGTVLGTTAADYDLARAALDSFAMYPSSMAEVVTGPGPLAEGEIFIALIRGYGVNTLLPGRVLESFDEQGPELHRHGFTFGTVRGHVEQGVERFEVSWNATRQEVRFDARAVSRPGPLLRLVSPLARRLQLRFHRLSPGSILASAQQRTQS